MKNIAYRSMIALCCAGMLLSACQESNTPSNTPAQIPAPTTVPTTVPIPTPVPTVEPTETPEPTPTSIPTSAPESERMEISFYVWDGVEGYERLLERTDETVSVTLYLNPVDAGENRFVENTEAVQANGAKVWYLISGDPSFDYIQDQIDMIVAYNSDHAEKVEGMSFDMEPWIAFEDQNSSENQESWQAYLDFMETAKEMLHESNLSISISIPFWIGLQTEASPTGRPLDYEVIDIADETLLMTYTVFAERIEPYTHASLHYASEVGKKVKVALEMVENSDENISFYTHPEDIVPILETKLNASAFSGYVIHDLDHFIESGVTLR